MGKCSANSSEYWAHASDVKISKIDASDLLDFAIAICDYVYVLRNKFEDFMKRRAIE